MCESAWCARESCHAFAAGRRTAPLSSDPAKLPAMAHFEQEDDLKVTMETPSMQQNPFANCCSNLYHSICFWRGIRAEDLDALQRRQKVCVHATPLSRTPSLSILHENLHCPRSRKILSSFSRAGRRMVQCLFRKRMGRLRGRRNVERLRVGAAGARRL